MYKNIAFGKVRFPRDALSQEGRNFVKGLLNRNPAHRLGAKKDAEELMEHPFFSDIDWTALSKKMVSPPFKPKLKGELDTSNFDPEFTNALTDGNPSSLNARAAALASGVNSDSTPLSPTMQNQFKGFTFVDESTLEQQYADRIFAYGANTEYLREGALEGGMAPEDVTCFATHEALAEALRRAAQPGDALLFKGSRAMKMEN